MMSPLVLLVCVGVVAVGADLAGVTVTDGDCLCVVGTGVNARDRRKQSSVHGTGAVQTTEKLEIIILKINGRILRIVLFGNIAQNVDVSDL